MGDIENHIDATSDAYTSYGYRGGNKNFHVEKGVVHVFKLSKIIYNLENRNAQKCSVYCQYKSLEDVKKEYVRRKIVQLYDKTTCIGQKLELLIQYARKLTDDKIIVSFIPFRTTNLNSTLKTKFKEVNGSI